MAIAEPSPEAAKAISLMPVPVLPNDLDEESEDNELVCKDAL